LLQKDTKGAKTKIGRGLTRMHADLVWFSAKARLSRKFMPAPRNAGLSCRIFPCFIIPGSYESSKSYESKPRFTRRIKRAIVSLYCFLQGVFLMDQVYNAHDKLFRETWSNKENARSFLMNYLPDNVLELVDMDSLEISKDSFVEKELKEYFSDLLYMVDFKGAPGYVYLLFEHKSYADKLIHLQLLEYILKIWRLHLKQNKSKPLPIVIPLVLYHGRSKWKFGTDLFSMISGPYDQLADYIPDFRFILYDLSRYSDEDIKGTVLSKTVLLLLKHIFDADIADKLPGILSLLRELMDKSTGLQYLETIIRYLFSTMEQMGAGEIDKILKKSLSDKQGDVIMTIADELRMEGEKKGYAQGIQIAIESILESIELDLDLKFGKDGLNFMPQIRSINDINKLKTIMREIKVAKSSDDLKSMLN